MKRRRRCVGLDCSNEPPEHMLTCMEHQAQEADVKRILDAYRNPVATYGALERVLAPRRKQT